MPPTSSMKAEDDEEYREALKDLHAPSDDDDDDSDLFNPAYGLSQTSRATTASSGSGSSAEASADHDPSAARASCTGTVAPGSSLAVVSSEGGSSSPAAAAAAPAAATKAQRRPSLFAEGGKLSKYAVRKAHLEARSAADAWRLPQTSQPPLEQALYWFAEKSVCLPCVMVPLPERQDMIDEGDFNDGKAELQYLGATHQFRRVRQHVNSKKLAHYYENPPAGGRKNRRNRQFAGGTSAAAVGTGSASVADAEPSEKHTWVQCVKCKRRRRLAAAASSLAAAGTAIARSGADVAESNGDGEARPTADPTGSSAAEHAGDGGDAGKDWDCSMNSDDLMYADCKAPERNEDWYRRAEVAELATAAPASKLGSSSSSCDDDDGTATTSSPAPIWSPKYLQKYKTYLKNLAEFKGEDVEYKLLVESLFLMYLLDRVLTECPSSPRPLEKKAEEAEENYDEDEDEDEHKALQPPSHSEIQVALQQPSPSSQERPQPLAAREPPALDYTARNLSRQTLRAGDIIKFCPATSTAVSKNFRVAMILNVHRKTARTTGTGIALETHLGALGMISGDQQVQLLKKWYVRSKSHKEVDCDMNDVDQYRLDDKLNGEFEGYKLTIDMKKIMEDVEDKANKAIKKACSGSNDGNNQDDDDIENACDEDEKKPAATRRSNVDGENQHKQRNKRKRAAPATEKKPPRTSKRPRRSARRST